MPVRLIDSLTTTAPLADIFSDASVLRAMARFEVALAQVEGQLGIIPAGAAEAIHQAATPENFNVASLTSATLLSATALSATPLSGTPAIPFVKQLTEQVRSVNPFAAGFVHWGATSQDLCDTAMILLLQEARAIFAANIQRLETQLSQLAGKHADTVMLGRTLLQPATPITFGLKAAGWLGATHRARKLVDQAFDEALVLQFGGASGTLAALGDRGLEVAAAMARHLKLRLPDAPWHAHRDRLATLLSACGVLVGVLAKMARDITLLMQPEVGEVREASAEGQGGSSTMPHKQNPVGCTLTLAAANRTPGLVANYLSGMVQEHERGAGGWQAEWSTIADVMSATGMAISSMATVTDGLTVDAARMRANIEAMQGRIFAEKAMILLGAAMGRDVAHKLVEDATRRSVEQGRRLKDVLAEMKAVQQHISPQELKSLEDPEAYIGSARAFQQRLVASAGQDHAKRQKG
jgi:3-carboxy-cis,cis-muconate cycloisomerase